MVKLEETIAVTPRTRIKIVFVVKPSSQSAKRSLFGGLALVVETVTVVVCTNIVVGLPIVLVVSVTTELVVGETIVVDTSMVVGTTAFVVGNIPASQC
jgi:hypothetical protein